MNSKDTRRRIAIVRLTPEFLASFLLHGVAQPHQRIVPEHDWPDLEIVAIREGPPWRGDVELLCRSSAFEEVPDAGAPPILDKWAFRIEYCGCRPHEEVGR